MNPSRRQDRRRGTRSGPEGRIAMGVLCLAAWAGAVRSEVTVREEPFTQPYYLLAPAAESAPGERRRYEPQRQKDKTYRSVVLESRYLRIRLLPELGGVLYRAVFKPTGDDLFYYEGLGKNWYVFWESGVKASFPWAEHGMVNWGQPASWRVLRRPDGSVTVAQWMEFSRNRGRHGHGGQGGYSALLLSQNVTLCPGAGTFRVTYRLVNPAPWRQGRRLWNDAFFPHNHTAAGAVQQFELPPAECNTELILPCAWVSFHRGQKLRRWDPAWEKLGSPGSGGSIFPWQIPFGFAGVYYPEVRVNRLRLADPRLAPGTKVYVENRWSAPEGAQRLSIRSNYNFIELWGGTDSVFEGVENWLGPGECFSFTHAFGLARGIGKVSFADRTLALSVNFEEPNRSVGIVTWRPVERVEVALDGVPLSRAGGEPDGCAPERPAHFGLPPGATQGVVTVSLDAREVLSRRFPLEIPDDTSAHGRIREALRAPGEMRADTPDRNWGQPGAGHSAGRYAKGSTARGRVLYRLGRVDEALTCLRRAVEAQPGDGEAWHLLGVARLERESAQEARAALSGAVSVETPYPAARFYLAVLDLARQDPAAALRKLRSLTGEAPAHWEGRLLAAFLQQSVPEAVRLEAEDPADPRAVWVLRAVAAHNRETDIARAASEALDQLLTEPGAAARVDEFKALTEGRYRPPSRLHAPATAAPRQ